MTEFQALADRVEALEALLARPVDQPEFLTIPESAELMRCKRQRVDDLLSSGRLERVKDGSRTLLRRSGVLAYLDSGGRTGGKPCSSSSR
jgi:excisionase family DNA binding protein